MIQYRNIHHFAFALLVFAVAAYMRFSGLDAYSLSLDESTLAEFARGVLANGYPSIFVGSMEVPLATYELVPYPMAGSMAIFGVNDFAARLPSASFGSLTALLVYIVGARWFNWRVGLLAGLIYALSPWAIYWSHNCFHPNQTQFFAMLLAVQVRVILSADQVPPRIYYLAALFFTCTYLSWEGSGFVLPIIVVVALLMSWGRWHWASSPHLWIAGIIVVTVVVIQGVRRLLLQTPYLMVGSGKSDMSLPQLMFTKPEYNPDFYFNIIFGTETHIILGIVFSLGFTLIFRNWNLRFVYMYTLVAILCMTNLLGFYNSHYIYYILPMFYIASAAAAVLGMEALLFGKTAVDKLASVRWLDKVIAFCGVTLLLASATPFGLKPYHMDESFKVPRIFQFRLGLTGIDYRGLAYSLREHYQPGDKVIAMTPLALRFYSGLGGDHFLQSITGRKVVFDPNAETPAYVDKYVGNPVLRNRAELEDLLARHPRVWLYAVPYFGYTDVVDKELRGFIDSNLRVVAESYDGRLYLWER
ncbi:MAG: glycosyltransferase family 39 protein [Kordiimonadaceae bacterium]|nr:glycosyltransferase family 39 protein [Kordiimonadaceae bacterium]